MVRLRTGVAMLALCASSSALAQPAPPPPPAPQPQPQPSGPQDPYAPDPVLSEQIAEQLVTRAQELLDAKIYLDAKQLAVEALVKSPKGNAAERARFIIKTVNQHLDIKEDPAPVPPGEVKPTDNVDLTPIQDPTQPTFDPSKDPPPTQQPDTLDIPDGRNAATVHGALYGGVLGATVGAYINSDNPASVAVPLGIVTGLGSGFLSRRYYRRLGWDAAQIRTAGSLNLWGGVIGGLFGGAVTGAGAGTPTATGILLGASIGSTAGLLTGVAVARNKRLTTGDVALVDTFAGMGAVGGLTLGMLMQPAQSEAYAVNSMIGVIGGVAVGVIAGPLTNTTQRRMLRVAALAAAGGALPFLLYAGIYDSNSSADERVVGLLSTLGLVGGAYLGFRLTRNMDVGLDVLDKKASPLDAPAAVVGRNSDGSWVFGGLKGLTPVKLSKDLGQNLGVKSFTLFGGRF